MAKIEKTEEIIKKTYKLELIEEEYDAILTTVGMTDFTAIRRCCGLMGRKIPTFNELGMLLNKLQESR